MSICDRKSTLERTPVYIFWSVLNLDVLRQIQLQFTLMLIDDVPR